MERKLKTKLWLNEQELHTRRPSDGREGQKTQTRWSSESRGRRCSEYMERRSRALPREGCAPALCRARREASYRDTAVSRGRVLRRIRNEGPNTRINRCQSLDERRRDRTRPEMVGSTRRRTTLEVSKSRVSVSSVRGAGGATSGRYDGTTTTIWRGYSIC